jgi:hypothetical protein
VLTWIFLVVVGLVLWALLGRPRARPLTAGERVQLESSLAVLAIERQLRWIEGSPPHAEGAIGGVAYRIFPHACGFPFDAEAAFVATTASATFAMAVWPRDPPDDALEFGSEVRVEDALFDARFVVLSDAPREACDVLGESVRRLLLDLGAPALLVRKGTVWLLLPDLPNGEQFELATSLVHKTARSLARSEQVPYR